MTDLENSLKKLLRLTHVETSHAVIYSLEYQGKVYQETYPVKEVIENIQKAINQGV